MRRHASTLFLLAAFCISTALLVCFVFRIAHEGALSLGIHGDNRARGPHFGAEAIFFFAAGSISTAYVLIGTFRDYLRDRRRKQLNKNRNA